MSAQGFAWVVVLFCAAALRFSHGKEPTPEEIEAACDGFGDMLNEELYQQVYGAAQ